MTKKIFFCCLAMMVVSIIPLISCSPAPAIAIEEHPHFLQRVQQIFRESSKKRTIPFPYDPLLNSLCANNVPGDYQHPYYCNTIIMCADGGEVFIQVCPGGLIFDPMLDDCIRPPTSVETEKCPTWPSVWNKPENVNCALAELDWWSPVTFPSNPSEICGRDIFLCMDSKPVENGKDKCNEGYGYSKAFFACLQLDDCKRIDKEFKLY